MEAGGGAAPGVGDIERIAAEVYRTIPKVLRTRADEVRIRVEEFPSEEVMREMALETPFDLLGLYQGVPFGEKSVSDVVGRNEEFLKVLFAFVSISLR